MKKSIFVLFTVLLAGLLEGCGFPWGCEPDNIGSESDLIGLWHDENNTQFHRRFTNDQTDIRTGYEGYKWGKEWDEGLDISENDVDQDEHGNGWFMWKKNGSTLILVETATASESVVTKRYTLKVLTSTRLEYQDNFGTNMEYFDKE